MNAIEPASRNPVMLSGGAVRAIVPQSMEDAYRLAKAICVAGMAPKGLDTPEKCMVAIMHGMEIGLPPMTALQRIAVVNGRPTIWGDGAMSLVRASGICEFVRERIEGQGDDRVAVCEAKRRHEIEPIIRSFSVVDAKRAGLWGKSGPWQQFPDRMLQMRARAFALRDGFADVLGGLYLKEEIEDERAGVARDFTPSIPRPPAPPAIESRPAPIEPRDPVVKQMVANSPQAPVRAPSPPAAAPEPEIVTPEDILTDIDENLSAAGDSDVLAQSWDLVSDDVAALPLHLRQQAESLYEAHMTRIGEG